MMLAHEFVRSHIARDADFTTHPLEREKTPDGRDHAVIAQFASSDPVEFARAAEMIAPWVDGVDLNCGWYVRNEHVCHALIDTIVVHKAGRSKKASVAP
jgi:tRNA-dihydrouridine synthase 4